MKGQKDRKDLVEFAVLAALVVPGLGLALGGLKLFEGAGGLTPVGVILVSLGGVLMVTAGYYHYRRDYAPARGFLAFAAITLVSAIAAVLATGALTRLFR